MTHASKNIHANYHPAKLEYDIVQTGVTDQRMPREANEIVTVVKLLESKVEETKSV